MGSAILVTARLKSTRLPHKALKPILGRPLIAHLFDRLKTARKPDRIILCTSTLDEDTPLAALAETEGIDLYRGDPQDVLLRLTAAAKKFSLETVISCTGDNPFVDAPSIDGLFEFHRTAGYDFSRVEGLPFGTFAYALSSAAMERACEIKDGADTETWGGYFTESGVFNCGVWNVTDPAIHAPELRLTVDTEEDFTLVTRVFEKLYAPPRVFTLAQIVELCRRHPELPALNAGVKQKPAGSVRFKISYLDEKRPLSAV